MTVKKAEKRTQAEVEVETSYVDLFGIDSSQSQRSDDPPSPPPCRLKKRHSEDREVSHAVDGDDGDEDDNDIDDEDNDNNGGGKRGGSGRGGGKRKKGFLRRWKYIIT